jgi:hypothetical protein
MKGTRPNLFISMPIAAHFRRIVTFTTNVFYFWKERDESQRCFSVAGFEQKLITGKKKEKPAMPWQRKIASPRNGGHAISVPFQTRIQSVSISPTTKPLPGGRQLVSCPPGQGAFVEDPNDLDQT